VGRGGTHVRGRVSAARDAFMARMGAGTRVRRGSWV